MTKRNKPAVEAEEEVLEEAVEAEEEVVSNSQEVTVVWRNGTRNYSKAVHGADFMKLAKEFAQKVEGRIV